MKRKLIFIILLITFFVLTGWLFVAIKEKREINKEKMTIAVEDSSGKRFPLEINNVRKEAVRRIGNDFIIKNERDYQLLYFSKEEAFSIIVTGMEDLRVARQNAEEEFLVRTGLSREEACKLNVDLRVPADVNFQLAGKNYGLSFCPNGIPFPEVIIENSDEYYDYEYEEGYYDEAQ